jgi:hypothetical protein
MGYEKWRIMGAIVHIPESTPYTAAVLVNAHIRGSIKSS